MKYLIKNINDFSIEEINDFLKKIDDQKQNRLSKMHENSFKQSVVGEILLYELLKNEGIEYSNINIQLTENGKPYITNYQLYYNISHSDDMVICAINNFPIGVDILKMKKKNIHIAKTFCTDNEMEYINNLYRFYKIFTLKEAYIKLLGLKINDIKNINVVINNNILIDDNCMYKNFKKDNYMISICYR